VRKSLDIRLKRKTQNKSLQLTARAHAVNHEYSLQEPSLGYLMRGGN
jgi:hypothetical protein